MGVIPFLYSFFVSKKVSLLTAFVCWSPGEVHELWRGGQASGVRLRVVTDSDRLPELKAYDWHREGMLLDVTCPFVHDVLEQASKSRAFNHRHTWLLLHRSALNTSFLEDILSPTAIYPDADVTWASNDLMLDIYRVKKNLPLLLTNFDNDENSMTHGLEQLWARQPTTVTRRRDLKKVYLNAATIISQPQYFKDWNDLTDRQIDTYPKVTYPLMMLCAEDLNFRYNLQQVDLYGVETNGSFDGLAGLLQRNRIEVGIVSMFMRADRERVLHYCAETVELVGAFMFRQPSQSSVMNMFVLPFSRGVWAVFAGVFAASSLLLAALSRRLVVLDSTLALITPAESFTFALGAICQQGFHIMPNLMSIRVVMFFTLMTSLFAFTSYSAKIVAILQSPSNAIQTISDLTNSRMHLGVQETTYKNVYFAESTDPATQELYHRKLLPLGDRAYLSVVEGILQVRTGLFAFQVEQSPGYDIISKTFTEREKCDLKEIQAFKLPVVAVPIRKHSGYRELFAARLRWQRETGLLGRWRRTWMAVRPRCEAQGGGFVSVGLADVAPALHALCAGAGLAAALLAAECAVHAFRKRSTR